MIYTRKIKVKGPISIQNLQNQYQALKTENVQFQISHKLFHLMKVFC